MLPIRLRGPVSWLSLLGSLAFAGGAAGATVDLAPIKDNTLIETPVGNSNGAGDGIYAGRVGSLGGGTRRRGVLAFDLSSIPPGSTVDAVTLTLEMAQSPDLIARTVTLHRLAADWGEAGSFGLGQGGPAQPGDATWLFRFFSTVPWTTPGGDFVAAASAAASVTDIGPYHWTGAGLVADAQFWVDNPGSNFGWLARGDETVMSTVKKFYSREGLVPPKLTVTYTPVTGVGPGTGAEAVRFAPWPIPASGRVNLDYTLPREARVSLSIHDVTGRAVRRLAAGAVETAGRHAAVWDGRTDAGPPAPSGLYLAVLEVDGAAHLRRVPLVR